MDRMTDQEISDLFAAYNRAVANGTANTREWAERMKDAKVGIQGYTRAMKASQDALKASFVNLGKSIADGETGAAVYNDSIKSGADTVSKWLATRGPVGRAIGTLVQGIASYVGAVNKQADSLYKSFQEVSRTGTIGHSAMRDVYENMQKFGYGIKELDKFGSLMAQNSKELANFGGTAVDGAKAFANMATELQHSPITKDLMNMGMSVDEINQGAAGFIKQQTMMGRNQKDIGDKLTASSLKYIQELEVVSRLTGQTRKEQEEKIADAMAEEAFNATIRNLRKKEAEGDVMAGKQADKLELANRVLEGDMRKQVIRGAGGDIAALGPLINVAGSDLVDALHDPSKSIGDLLGSINKGYEGIVEAGGDQLQMMNNFNNTFGNTLEYEKLRSRMAQKDFDQQLETAKANLKSTDSTTKNMTETEIAQRKARDNIQDFVNFGINPTTKVMEILAKVIEWFTDLLPGAGKAREQYEMQKKTEATKTTKVGVYNKDGKMVYVSPEEAEQIKAGKAEAPEKSTVAEPGAPSVSTGGGWDDNTAGKTPAATGTTSPRAALADKIMSAESGGRNIANQSGEGGKATSSAFGLFQFTKGTFEGLAKNAKEGSALFGKTFEDYKKDTGLQREAMNVLMEQNAAKLSSKGLGTSDANMYLAHFLGAGGAAKALMAGPNALLTDVMSQEQLSANPSLKSMRTVADLQAWAEKKMGGTAAPASGYEPKLAGGEEPRGTLSKPTKPPMQTAEADETRDLLEQQIVKLNDIVSVVEKQTAIQGKILQTKQA